MRLVTCPACKTHLDVSGVEADAVACPCGASVEIRAVESRAGTVKRCGGCGASVDERAAVCGYCQSPIVREPQRLTLVCPDCLVRNPEGGKYCTGCGSEFLPQAPLDDGPVKACPACEQALVPRRVRDVWVRGCFACDGLWVPVASFDALVRRSEHAPEPPSAGLGARRASGVPAFDGRVVYRRCPECRQRMVRKNFGGSSGVIVDWCGRHGTWFDADELALVAAFVAAGGLDRRAAGASGSDAVRIVLEQAERADASPWTVLFEKLIVGGR